MTSAMAPSGRRPLALMSAFRGKQTCRLELRMSANDPKWSRRSQHSRLDPTLIACYFQGETSCRGWPWPGEFAMNRREMVAGNYSRIIALFACTLAFHCSCTAAEVRTEEFTVEVKGRTLAIMRYAAEGVNTRPAVLMLHGARGFGVGHLAYVESATTLAVNGIDAYLVSYFGPGESVACSRMASCFDAWTETVADVTTAILKRPESSGRVGLLGFSLGGAVAFASARDPRVGAAVIFYGFIIPGNWRAGPGRFAPLLVLHGDNDNIVPLSAGRELVKDALARGGRAEIVVYPGQPHGFSTWSRPIAIEAVERMTAFFRSELIQ
jgi:carboxymethylenebutenolidase